MDRSLDEIIDSRDDNRGGRAARRPRESYPRGPRRDERAPRRDDYPRDGVKKSYARENGRDNIDRDWVHDKFDDDDNRRPARGPRNDSYARRSPSPARDAAASNTIRADNLHYDLGQTDLRGLFSRIGTVQSIRILYDRQDRSQGTAFITYDYPEDARAAVREFDGANAMGQPIRLSIHNGAANKPARNPFDNVEKPSRSLFERISGDEGRNRGGRRGRSASPASRQIRPAPEGVDRYVPRNDRDSRSPVRRRGIPRENGRRPGARREESGRGRGGRGGRREGEGRQTVQGRPRKTAEELDAEMDNYWGSTATMEGTGATAAQAQTEPAREPQVATIPQGQNTMTGTTSAINTDDDIDLMVE